MGQWVKTGKVDTGSNREVGNHLPRARIHYHHLRLLAATDEQAVGLGVIGETRRCLRNPDRKAVLHLQRFRVEYHDLVGVLAVDINKAVGADHRLFAVALRFDRPNYIASRRIDGADIVRTVIIGEYTFRTWIVIDPIRSFAYVDFLDELQSSRVEHGNFVLSPIAGESVLESRGNRDPVDARRIRD